MHDSSDNGHGDPVLTAFTCALIASTRVLYVVGTELSAASGLATWRDDPVIVWRFYGERLLKSLASQPNAAHHALAALATWHPGWLTINQNVDGLLEQTAHPMSTLLGIHGSLTAVRCTVCKYVVDVRTPHDLPFLLALSDDNDQERSIGVSHLPRCPECGNLLRPGVVWFGERLAAGAPDSVDEWMSEAPVDLVIAIGTSLEVYPAAEWVSTARAEGASLLVIDIDKDNKLARELDNNDWIFKGDAAIIMPEMFWSVERTGKRNVAKIVTKTDQQNIPTVDTNTPEKRAVYEQHSYMMKRRHD
ncbi:uncharacterized protein PV09_09821 [Verruconis gallopava]|uniref:Deacetylase sirtuin-type domain-containing protein n=1 Tax=Verruconis gallopava TaxID=253628 RepID=A0A0D1X8J8_9PEZI|nr:uncharacterized protein PV09_09821 [Verruconis gallopava]KIV98335.1 hypothetical protein PV09_09821 [Verruconis gallopava]